ncbi:MAG: nucleoside triphosphate pyrophosphohydrolase [Notoacmeibacter sp.]
MEASKDILRLLEIMARLRDPKTGCAWDAEQTFASIMPYTIEEAYEVGEAIERNDMADLCDELGDLLLQVVFHARMAEEAGAFSFGDVVQSVTRKMIRRHPHVFGDESARSPNMAKGMWEKIKAEEKAEKRARKLEAGDREPSILDDVPRALPAFLEARKLQASAARVGFDWAKAAPILDKIAEETEELRHAIQHEPKGAIASEWGDLAFALVNLSRHLDIDPETQLKAANSKFRRRFSGVEQGLAKKGKTAATSSLEEMEAEWIAIKGLESST